MDFVGKSDAEIIHLFQNKYISLSSETSCGRFSSNQLNREIRANEEEKSPDLVKWLAGLLLAGSTGQVFSQQVPDSIQNSIENRGEAGFVQLDMLPVVADSIPISDGVTDFLFFGKVVNKEDGKGLPGVRIELVGTDLKSYSGKHGRFSLSIPRHLLSDSLPIIFTFQHEYFAIGSVLKRAEELGEKQMIELKSLLTNLECVLMGDIVMGGLGISNPSEPEKPIAKMIDSLLLNTHAALEIPETENNPRVKIDRSPAGMLLLPILQTILPSRRRKKK